jgi:hypothetical protein
MDTRLAGEDIWLPDVERRPSGSVQRRGHMPGMGIISTTSMKPSGIMK